MKHLILVLIALNLTACATETRRERLERLNSCEHLKEIPRCGGHASTGGLPLPSGYIFID